MINVSQVKVCSLVAYTDKMQQFSCSFLTNQVFLLELSDNTSDKLNAIQRLLAKVNGTNLSASFDSEDDDDKVDENEEAKVDKNEEADAEQKPADGDHNDNGDGDDDEEGDKKRNASAEAGDS
jgi:hypothetical protein